MLLLTPKFRDWLLHRSAKSAWKSFTSWIERIWGAGLVGVILSIPLGFSIYHLCGGKGSYQTGLMSDPLSLYPTLISLFSCHWWYSLCPLELHLFNLHGTTPLAHFRCYSDCFSSGMVLLGWSP
ncbi:hypothetical protein K435DRAFT_247549 [Dendrothele bispora CBS 962.96]|uniref:Uncharacterized protein n=1 Tax=Dendrothele bispora (strain CBS 962.96) TaxID=1314807 RepID=A0A4S8MLN4_DENBC|nr:hypothetical protein K435DRAFT_247549 [Dendrothele bispora CBS 962.96]